MASHTPGMSTGSPVDRRARRSSPFMAADPTAPDSGDSQRPPRCRPVAENRGTGSGDEEAPPRSWIVATNRLWAREPSGPPRQEPVHLRPGDAVGPAGVAGEAFQIALLEGPPGRGPRTAVGRER